MLTPPIIVSPIRFARVIAVEFPIGNPSLFTNFVALPKILSPACRQTGISPQRNHIQNNWQTLKKKMKNTLLIFFFSIQFFNVYSQQDGEHITYHKNGEIESISNYENGVLKGEYTTYHENGKLYQSITYVHGVQWGEFTVYYNSGQLKLIGDIQEERKTGEWRSYHKNGRLQSLHTFSSDKLTGETIIYHENAQLHEIGKYNENGKQTGQWKTYHDNCELKLIGTYKDGVQIGEWNAYDRDGNIITTENF